MPLDFPNSPSLNQSYTSAGISWSWDGAKWLNVPQAGASNPSLNNVGRNLLHNPLFNVAQRGVGPWGVAGYTVDRWIMIVTTDAINTNQFALTDGARAQIGDEAASFGWQNTFVGNAAAGAFNLLGQRIESVRRLANKTITVSFYANASASLKLGVSLDQMFGNGGSPSAVVSLNGQSVTVSTTWTRYSVTLTLPSISGKTLGTAGDDATYLNFWFSSGATNNVRSGSVGVQSGTIQLWGVQLEVGSVATPLDYGGSPQQQLANCQRFFQIGNFSFNGYASATGVGYCYTQSFPVVMRAQPTTTITPSTATNVTGQTLFLSAYGVTPYITGAAVGPYVWNATFTASADL